MPYTLSMALLWVALAVLLGIVVGWLMRSVVAKRQVERARANHLDTVEIERLRSRVVELEAAPAPTGAGPDAVGDIASPDNAPERTSGTTPDTTSDSTSDTRTAIVASAGDTTAGTSDDLAAPVGGTGQDTATTTDVLGSQIDLDDLTVVEGIGPKIADLCGGIGIQTWRDLAQTEVSLLRTMLHDAGPRFRSHDPSSWPEQAALLADGRWAEFRSFTERRKEDRAVD